MFRMFLTVSGWTILSRFLGLVRDQCLAAFVGAGMMQDAYQVAARLPNMFRRLFGEGAFNAAFVPIFSSLLANKDKEAARRFACTILGLLIAGLVILCLVGEVFMPQILYGFAPGFTQTPREYHLTVTLCRITFPYLIFICSVALLSGVLNGLHNFGLAAASYLIFNIIGIGCILGGYWAHTTIVVVAAWGICAAGILQFLFLLWSCHHCHFPMLSVRGFALTQSVKKFGQRLVPGLIGSGAGQINLVVDTIIGTFLPTGSISIMYFADRVNQLPLGVIGAACGTTLLPVLSYYLIRGEGRRAALAQNKTLTLGMMLALPATCGLFVLAKPILLTLFGHGAFHHEDAFRSAQCLYVYALGLPAFILVKIITPSFFARGDTQTPVYVGLGTIILNIVLNLLLMGPFTYMGPPLASSLCAIINVVILCCMLVHKKQLLLFQKTRQALCKIIIATVFMGGGVFSIQSTISYPESIVSQFLWLIGCIVFGASFYFIVLYVLRFRALHELRRLKVRRRL